MGEILKFRKISASELNHRKIYASCTYDQDYYDKFVEYAKNAETAYKSSRMYDKKFDVMFLADNYMAKELSKGLSVNRMHNILGTIYNIAYCNGVNAYRKHKDRIDRSCGWS